MRRGKKVQATIDKFNRQAIGQAELAQVLRMVQNRIEYLRTHATTNVEERIAALEQYQLAAVRLKIK